MPLYEYQCDSCGGVFEVIQKFADAPLTVHDGCGGRVGRLLSAPALQFKGTGWYITDYARKNSSGGKEGKSEGKSGSGDAGGKKESKSDAPASSPSASKDSGGSKDK